MKTYPSLNVAVFDLRRRGYRLDFLYKSGYLKCVPLKIDISFKNVDINEAYSFPSLLHENVFNTVFAVTTKKGFRGIVFDCNRAEDYSLSPFTSDIKPVHTDNH